jgi:TATA-binding protein-associated factor
LDEAHILKNSRNKSSKVIKSLKARHKVVLSGTPVQNHLLELWSLFDILFPNYLGDEEYFKKHFAKAFHTNLFSLNNEELLFDEQQTKTLK